MSLTRRERERLKAEGYLEPDPSIASEGDVGPRALAALLGAGLGFLVGVPVAPGLGFTLVALGGVAGWFAAGALGEAVESAVDAVWTVDPDAEDEEPETQDGKGAADEAQPAEATPDDEAAAEEATPEAKPVPADEATQADEGDPKPQA